MNHWTAFPAQLRNAWLRSQAAATHCAELLRNILAEIFDESAYARFLARQGLVSSRATYAEFQREGQAARERRARCC